MKTSFWEWATGSQSEIAREAAAPESAIEKELGTNSALTITGQIAIGVYLGILMAAGTFLGAWAVWSLIKAAY